MSLLAFVPGPCDDLIDLDSEDQDDTDRLQQCNWALKYEEGCLVIVSAVESLEDVVLAVNLDPVVLEEFVHRIVLERVR